MRRRYSQIGMALLLGLASSGCARTDSRPTTATLVAQITSPIPSPLATMVPPTFVPTVPPTVQAQPSAVVAAERSASFAYAGGLAVLPGGRVAIIGTPPLGDATALATQLWLADAAGIIGQPPLDLSSSHAQTSVLASSAGTLFALDDQRNLLVINGEQVHAVPLASALPADAEPVALASGSGGDVLVLDSAHSRVYQFSREGALLHTWELAPPSTQGWRWSALAVDSAGNIYVAGGSSIARIDASSGAQTSLTVPHTCTGDPDLGEGPQGIGGIAVAADGHLVVSDQGCTTAHHDARVLHLSATGTVLAAWPIQDERSYPTALATDAHGRVYATLQIIHGGTPSTVIVFAPDGAVLARWHGQE